METMTTVPDGTYELDRTRDPAQREALRSIIETLRAQTRRRAA